MDMKNFNPDSMERALLHHVKEGRLVEYQRVDANGARARWYVTGNAGIHAQSETMSDRECAALCFGLASAQFGERDRRQHQAAARREEIAGLTRSTREYLGQ